MGAKWIKIAALYFIIGIGFGLFMLYTIQLQWGATHAHINVVGWLSTGLIGVIYSVYPKAGNSQLGKLQFWLHQIGLPFLLIGMMMIYLDVPLIVLEIFVSGGGVAFLISVVLFIINLFQNVHASESK
ncbi:MULTISPECIES: hypothetical protein [Oceanobacillus]|uniref:Cytochrome-c oxidase n=1 Tax=Oceanobacillus indicireducens TaxID=1004261 RepID=A0A917XS27_9BACI|nr:hypothetical protein [Oceanobacillus indicireducens]GGN50808.1 hypothetical protein GCM10007971_04830 [Oceanobacillus indicireducens]